MLHLKSPMLIQLGEYKHQCKRNNLVFKKCALQDNAPVCVSHVNLFIEESRIAFIINIYLVCFKQSFYNLRWGKGDM